jgi:hypothetical protein
LKRCCCRGHHRPLKPHRQKFSVDLWLAYLRRGGIVTTPSPAEPARIRCRRLKTKQFHFEREKFQVAGLTPMGSELVKPARVKECPVHRRREC